jgi:hypothetical protein
LNYFEFELNPEKENPKPLSDQLSNYCPTALFFSTPRPAHIGPAPDFPFSPRTKSATGILSPTETDSMKSPTNSSPYSMWDFVEKSTPPYSSPYKYVVLMP